MSSRNPEDLIAECVRIAEDALNEAARISDQHKLPVKFSGPKSGRGYRDFPMAAKYFPAEEPSEWESSTAVCERQSYRGYDLEGWTLRDDLSTEEWS